MIVPCNITVDYDEKPGSPVERSSWTKFEVTRILQCDYSERHTLVKELIGYMDSGVLHEPHEYDPAYSSEDIRNIYCQSVDIKGIGPKSSSHPGAYEYAVLTAYYATPDYDIEPAPGETTYVSESLEPAAEFMTVSHEGLRWATDETYLNSTEAPGQLIRMTDWVYTIHRSETIPDAYFTLPGYVNSAAVYSRQLNKWFAAETLLCGNPSLSREITSYGVTAWTVTFRFTHRNMGTYAVPLGWNHFPHHNTTGAALTWDRITDSALTNRYFYPLGDFSTLIA
jgi:hypothetical protein